MSSTQDSADTVDVQVPEILFHDDDRVEVSLGLVSSPSIIPEAPPQQPLETKLPVVVDQTTLTETMQQPSPPTIEGVMYDRIEASNKNMFVGNEEEQTHLERTQQQMQPLNLDETLLEEQTKKDQSEEQIIDTQQKQRGNEEGDAVVIVSVGDVHDFDEPIIGDGHQVVVVPEETTVVQGSDEMLLVEVRGHGEDDAFVHIEENDYADAPSTEAKSVIKEEEQQHQQVNNMQEPLVDEPQKFELEEDNFREQVQDRGQEEQEEKAKEEEKSHFQICQDEEVLNTVVDMDKVECAGMQQDHEKLLQHEQQQNQEEFQVSQAEEEQEAQFSLKEEKKEPQCEIDEQEAKVKPEQLHEQRNEPVDQEIERKDDTIANVDHQPEQDTIEQKQIQEVPIEENEPEPHQNQEQENEQRPQQNSKMKLYEHANVAQCIESDTGQNLEVSPAASTVSPSDLIDTSRSQMSSSLPETVSDKPTSASLPITSLDAQPSVVMTIPQVATTAPQGPDVGKSASMNVPIIYCRVPKLPASVSDFASSPLTDNAITGMNAMKSPTALLLPFRVDAEKKAVFWLERKPTDKNIHKSGSPYSMMNIHDKMDNGKENNLEPLNIAVPRLPSSSPLLQGERDGGHHSIPSSSTRPPEVIIECIRSISDDDDGDFIKTVSYEDSDSPDQGDNEMLFYIGGIQIISNSKNVQVHLLQPPPTRIMKHQQLNAIVPLSQTDNGGNQPSTSSGSTGSNKFTYLMTSRGIPLPKHLVSVSSRNDGSLAIDTSSKLRNENRNEATRSISNLMTPYYKTMCVIPGGARAVTKIKLVFENIVDPDTNTPPAEAKIVSIRLTARIAEISTPPFPLPSPASLSNAQPSMSSRSLPPLSMLQMMMMAGTNKDSDSKHSEENSTPVTTNGVTELQKQNQPSNNSEDSESTLLLKAMSYLIRQSEERVSRKIDQVAARLEESLLQRQRDDYNNLVRIFLQEQQEQQKQIQNLHNQTIRVIQEQVDQLLRKESVQSSSFPKQQQEHNLGLVQGQKTLKLQHGADGYRDGVDNEMFALHTSRSIDKSVATVESTSSSVLSSAHKLQQMSDMKQDLESTLKDLQKSTISTNSSILPSNARNKLEHTDPPRRPRSASDAIKAMLVHPIPKATISSPNRNEAYNNSNSNSDATKEEDDDDKHNYSDPSFSVSYLIEETARLKKEYAVHVQSTSTEKTPPSSSSTLSRLEEKLAFIDNNPKNTLPSINGSTAGEYPDPDFSVYSAGEKGAGTSPLPPSGVKFLVPNFQNIPRASNRSVFSDPDFSVPTSRNGLYSDLTEDSIASTSYHNPTFPPSSLMMSMSMTDSVSTFNPKPEPAVSTAADDKEQNLGNASLSFSVSSSQNHEDEGKNFSRKHGDESKKNILGGDCDDSNVSNSPTTLLTNKYVKPGTKLESSKNNISKSTTRLDEYIESSTKLDGVKNSVGSKNSKDGEIKTFVDDPDRRNSGYSRDDEHTFANVDVGITAKGLDPVFSSDDDDSASITSNGLELSLQS